MSLRKFIILLLLLNGILIVLAKKKEKEMNYTEGCSVDVMHEKYYLKYHGILQYTSFFLLVPLAIASAHYLRDFAPSLTPMGLRIWFHLHRTCNLLAVLLTIIGIIMTFIVHKWKWIGPKEGCPEKPTASMCHALFGIIAVSLLWLQPIGAMFRCSPSHNARKWFYYSHKTIGILAWTLSAITIMIATAKFKPYFSNQPTAFILSIIVALLCIIAFVIGEFMHYNSNAVLWNNMSTAKTQSVSYNHSTLAKKNSGKNMQNVQKVKIHMKILNVKYRPLFFVIFAISIFVIWIVFITLIGSDKADD
uniref:ascorbate ferrireductase (transmembrane) n=2 Tax=Acrobeloides nanus TaxID=290746 RepID=A0A914DG38_9BILA